MTGRECRECGETFEPKKFTAQFCSTKCRKAFGNRRMTRGAELYDLMMANRFDRADAEEHHAWRMMGRMASHFRMQDERDRDGRKSWRPVAEALEDKPYLNAMVMTGAKR